MRIIRICRIVFDLFSPEQKKEDEEEEQNRIFRFQFSRPWGEAMKLWDTLLCLSWSCSHALSTWRHFKRAQFYLRGTTVPLDHLRHCLCGLELYYRSDWRTTARDKHRSSSDTPLCEYTAGQTKNTALFNYTGTTGIDASFDPLYTKTKVDDNVAYCTLRKISVLKGGGGGLWHVFSPQKSNIYWKY